MEEMQERLKREYAGKELREFLISESEEKIGNREVWIFVGNQWNLLYHSNEFARLLGMGSKVRCSSIRCIMVDEQDITIIIPNPFKGVD